MITAQFFDSCGPPLVIATHMRSGTHLAMDLLRRQFKSCQSWKWPGEANDSLYLALDVFSVLDADWGESRAKRILRKVDRPLLKTHWTAPDMSNLRGNQPMMAEWVETKGTFLHIVRNPFKVLASLWAWECSSGMVTDRMPSAEWIKEKILCWNEHCLVWSQLKDAHLFRFEDLILKSQATLNRLVGILDEEALMTEPLLPSKLNGKWHSRRNRLFRIQPESTEIVSDQKPLKIDTLFTDRAVQTIDEVAGATIKQFGYSLESFE